MSKEYVCKNHVNPYILGDRQVITPVRNYLGSVEYSSDQDDTKNNKRREGGSGKERSKLTRRGVAVLFAFALVGGAGGIKGMEKLGNRLDEKTQMDHITDNVSDTRVSEVIVGKDVNTIWEAALLVEGIDPRLSVEIIKELNPGLNKDSIVQDGDRILIPNPNGNKLIINDKDGNVYTIDLPENDEMSVTN